MSIKFMLMFMAMIAFAVVTCHWIGWQYPLAAQPNINIEPRRAIFQLACVEFGWAIVNGMALFHIRSLWKRPATIGNAIGGALLALSIVAQVFLGHSAYRDLNDLIMEWEN